MIIRAVIFDLDDTLIDDYGSTRQSIEATADEMARLSPGLVAEELVEAYWRESNVVWTNFQRVQEAGRNPEEGTGNRLRHAAWRRALRACGVADEQLVRGAVATYAQFREKTIQLAPETQEVLEMLRALVRTAIITNGATDLQRWKLHHLDIERRVDYSIVAEEFGVGKPDPAIFLHVAHMLGVAPQECIMVGDNIALDIAGAQAAGMFSAWMNRDTRPLPTDAPRPNYIIQDLYEVLDILWGQR